MKITDLLFLKVYPFTSRSKEPCYLQKVPAIMPHQEKNAMHSSAPGKKR